jgi:hypothetical protein
MLPSFATCVRVDRIHGSRVVCVVLLRQPSMYDVVFCVICAYLFMPLAACMPLRVLDPTEFGMRPGQSFSQLFFVCHECAIGKHAAFRLVGRWLVALPFRVHTCAASLGVLGGCTCEALGCPAGHRTLRNRLNGALCCLSARCFGLWNAWPEVHLPLTPSMKPWDSEFHRCLCRALDYWQGYKYFCYAYYSHSQLHEPEFRATKLGSCFRSTAWVIAKVLCWIFCSILFCECRSFVAIWVTHTGAHAQEN